MRTAKPPSGYHHVSQVFNLPENVALDFFDINLKYDSPVAIDPFLIKKSSVIEERLLFECFGQYFKFAYRQSIELAKDSLYKQRLEQILGFHEPKSICMGYTEKSNKGHGPNLIARLMEFFLEHSARRFIEEKDAFPDAQYNPTHLELFMKGIGPDGISDIAANLLMDFLIKYTQDQCNQWKIPLQIDVGLDQDGFDFGNMQWSGGGYYNLPTNPFQPDEPFILVPKRWIRALDQEHIDHRLSAKVIYLLKQDPVLVERFADLIQRKIKEVSKEEILAIFKEYPNVHRRYFQLLEQERAKPYDLDTDPYNILADRVYSQKHLDTQRKITNCRELKNAVDLLIQEFKHEFSARDGWKNAWTEDGGRPKRENAIGRVFRAMGHSFFVNHNDVTFIAEMGTGNGLTDFAVIYKNCKVVIELKLLNNHARKGADEKIPAYLHGIRKQLPSYAISGKAQYAYYITGQHYNNKKMQGKDHTPRLVEIANCRGEIEESLKANLGGFYGLEYINVDMSQRASASNI